MKRLILLSLSLVSVLRLSAAAPAAPTQNDVADRVAKEAVTEYTQRLNNATLELTQARQRIAAETKPLLDATRRVEDQIVTLDAEVAQLEVSQSSEEDKRQKLSHDNASLLKNLSYLNTLARDSFKGLNDSLLPGEAELFSTPLAEISQHLESSRGLNAEPAIETLNFFLEHIREQLGGYTREGKSLVGDNRMVSGKYLYLGPEVFFRSTDGSVSGPVRVRQGSTYPFTFTIPNWSTEHANAVFQGQEGSLMLDPTGGKALRLRETTGTVWQHIDKGGVVAYIILGVGLFAFCISLQKLADLAKLRVDPPATVEHTLPLVVNNAPELAAALKGLRQTTRELFTVGMRNIGKPKEVLEEHLYAFTMRQRLHFERRLPLLAVIATAAPLMGLLGTVMGMVKTFALITVFGTGNAAKLSSGISEVLVTTELGLAVAIPTLVIHGFLSHRIQKQLSLLERYAVEFAAAAGESKTSQREALRVVQP